MRSFDGKDYPNVEAHAWERIIFRNSPAMKCSTCGFVWQAHMHASRIRGCKS